MFTKEKQFERLMQEHNKALHNYLISRFGFDLNTVEDVVQESFVKAYLNFESFDQSKSFKAWLFAIGINTARSFKRKSFESLDALSEVQLLGFYKQENPELVYERLGIIKALSLLKEEERFVLEQLYFKDYSVEQIARQLKMPVNSVKLRISRAIKKLSAEFMAH